MSFYAAEVCLNFPQLFDLVVELVKSFMLYSFLVLAVFERARHEVVEYRLRLIDHVLVEGLLQVYLIKLHVGHLFDPIEV